MKKIILFLMSISIACVIQSHDCRLTDFLKKDWMLEYIKEENISLDDLGILGTSPFYQIASKAEAFSRYYSCIDAYEHRYRYEQLKQYRSKIKNNGTYYKDRDSKVCRNLRDEQMWLFTHDNSKATGTMEFRELYDATKDYDLVSELLCDCNAEKTEDNPGKNCDGWQKKLKKALARKEFAVKDFEETSGEKNPFTD